MKKLERLKELSVLYVEDDETVRETMQNILNYFFKEIFIAENGEEGLKMFKEKSPDMVLSDIEMPKMNGLELAKEIRKLNPNIPIAFFSGYGKEYFENVNFNLNSFVLIRKPFEVNSLKEAFLKLLGVVDEI